MPMDRAPIFASLATQLPGVWNVEGNIAAFDRIIDSWEAAQAPAETQYAFPVAAIDADLLALVSSKSAAELEQWVAPIQAACANYEITTIRRVAAFITTLAHEAGFKVGARENMNYSAKRLSQVWPHRYGRRGPNQKAKSLDRNPEAIANDVYANRMGNGPASSGDGWRFRGTGPIQLTGRDNFTAFADHLGIALEEAEALILTVEGGIQSAAWFWDENDINRLADTPGIADETRRINGGTNGIADRKKKFDGLVDELLERERAVGG
ncbi:hypothetical protein MWU38_02155 [Qipengyuania sp. S6317L1]|uniref:glycoside hydrolase family 19 protein n=1 Tax=Qipengyuania sp. S6317L1 TaxID=2926410 RepID=UPI001FF39F82|nr:hypothetical protein [Qipengyuania sp. S6317L1]MCK0098174.1 hypothetical protein [Qipengyuania sp. S6317L1]